jgi:hypothetical protein
MDVDDLIRRAWEAVEKAGVPEALQKMAFREAIDFLRFEDAPDEYAARGRRIRASEAATGGSAVVGQLPT